MLTEVLRKKCVMTPISVTKKEAVSLNMSHVSHLILIEEGMRINSKPLCQILRKSSEVICVS